MPTAGMNWIHRRVGSSETYFVANPQHREVQALCTFRVRGLQPELWDPATGEVRKPAVFQETAQGTQVPLRFDPAGSVFVVFREKASPATQVVEIARDGVVLCGPQQQAPARVPELWLEGKETRLARGEPGRYTIARANGTRASFDVDAPAAPLSVAGPWTVQFQSGRGAPPKVELAQLVDWSRHSNEGVRHFSGTATYSAQFDWAGPVQGQRYQLNLGDVQVMAEVRLNGKDLGVLWKPPYAVDVSKALKRGRNQLEIKVTNLWPNRLIGDEQYPDDCTPDGSWKTGPIPAWPGWLLKGQPRPEPRRVTFTTWKYYTKDSPLLPSGLLGPVTMRAEVTAAAREVK